MAQPRRPKSRPDPAARTPPERRRLRPDWLLAGIAAVGVGVTAYLSATALGDTMPAFCVDGGGCELIQRSQWSTLFGLPVAFWGLLTYALLVLLALLPTTRLRRWQRSWTVALIGLAISLYLTLSGLLVLEATCGWCLLSLALIGSIFVLLCLRRPVSAPGMSWRNWLLNHGLLVSVLLIALHLYWSGMFSPRAEPRMTALAEHLEASGAKFYGAFWCATCREQKALFGGAAESLPYVECHPNGRQGGLAFECVSAEIRSYPTWIIRGRRYEQVMHPDELASRSGFRYEPAEPAQAEPER
jgi:uncharacterized membrane protein